MLSMKTILQDARYNDDITIIFKSVSVRLTAVNDKCLLVKDRLFYTFIHNTITATQEPPNS